MPKREFNPEKQIQIIVDFIQNYFIENGNSNTKAVIGISGGKDSTIAAALLVRALGPDRVIGVMMPQDEQKDIHDALRVCETLGIKYYAINIGATCATLGGEFISQTGLPFTSQISTNMPARIRMTTLYMVAAAVGGRVCNTGNASEKFIGYTTKYGDLAGDFALFTELTVRELYQIGDALTELPSDLVHKTPADGMSDKTDEDNTGIPYTVIDDLLLSGKHPADMAIYEKMMTAHRRNQHKNCIKLPCPYRAGDYLRHGGNVEVWEF